MRNKILFILFVLILTSCTSITGYVLILENNIQEKKQVYRATVDLVDHEPIFIKGDEDFINQALVKEWSGNGTRENPYIIADYKISGSSESLITIWETSLYFYVTNCELITGTKGIILNSVSNGHIISNTISPNHKYDPRFDIVSYVEIISSRNITIKSNLIDGDVVFSSGISVYKSSNITFANNKVLNHGYRGLFLDESNNINVTSNFISNNYVGIDLIGTKESLIVGNIIVNHEGSGFSVSGGDLNTIEYNEFINNYGEGKSLSNSRQARDHGNNNNFSHNYWSDWVSPDRNNDHIVDLPYFIGSSLDNYDYFPNTHPYHYDPPEMIFLIGGETLNGTVILEWTSAEEKMNHSLNYEVFFKEKGSRWKRLAGGLVTTSYTWNTTRTYDCDNCLVKIVTTCSLGAISEIGYQTHFSIYNNNSRPVSTSLPASTVSTSILNSTDSNLSSEKKFTSWKTPVLITILMIIVQLKILRWKSKTRDRKE
ncbi:MAG: right-handed parallel beta-helix repeat-containing protein [Candidatus Hodarchaeales archaeon]|jgi:parallel beta-helix repeat protein